jgi:hypothetical protein
MSDNDTTIKIEEGLSQEEFNKAVMKRTSELVNEIMALPKQEGTEDDLMVEALAERIAVGMVLTAFIQIDTDSNASWGAYIMERIDAWTKILLEHTDMFKTQVVHRPGVTTDGSTN